MISIYNHNKYDKLVDYHCALYLYQTMVAYHYDKYDKLVDHHCTLYQAKVAYHRTLW